MYSSVKAFWEAMLSMLSVISGGLAVGIGLADSAPGMRRLYFYLLDEAARMALSWLVGRMKRLKLVLIVGD